MSADPFDLAPYRVEPPPDLPTNAPPISPVGACYCFAGHFFLRNGHRPDVVLVHGVVLSLGAPGWAKHGWCEIARRPEPLAYHRGAFVPLRAFDQVLQPRRVRIWTSSDLRLWAQGVVACKTWYWLLPRGTGAPVRS